MAASSTIDSVSWRELLNKHKLCKRLRENNAKDSANKQHREAKNFLTLHGSDLFIWDSVETAILHCNLRSLSSQIADHAPEGTSAARPSISNLGRSTQNGATVMGDFDPDQLDYQKLVITDSQSLTVEGIKANRLCTHILLWGPRSIRVAELPRRWGRQAAFEGGKDTVICRTVKIGDRDFQGNQTLRIRQVSWHPGSKTDSHIAILSSDNSFSVYDIREPQQPVSVINISTGDISRTLSPMKSFIGSALGETCVAFDFGASIALKPKQRLMQDSSPCTEVWPVYCLRGSGDVMLLYSHLSNFRPSKLPVQGPLLMYPPAEDNYGVDACSILCLSTQVPVLAISTCEGRVHHCVQLSASAEDNAEDSVNQSVMSVESGLYSAIKEPVLYVIESAELELCLNMPSIEENAPASEDQDFFMCSVRLFSDSCSTDRYYCSHSAGVHTVALPWLDTVQDYFNDQGGELDLTEDKECIVEHLFCTKPLYSWSVEVMGRLFVHTGPLAPVLGIDVVSDVMLGPCLLILNSDFEFTTLNLSQYYHSNSTLKTEDDQDKMNLTLRQSGSDSFLQHIKKILQRKTSHPLLKSSSNTELSQQECYQLLSRATQLLREEYIHRHDHAREELDNRVALLQSLKITQLKDLRKLVESRNVLRDHARNIAEGLDSCAENNETLVRRLDNVMRRLQNQSPTLSEAERRLMKELNLMKNNLQLYQQNIDQVKSKMDYQQRQISRAESRQSPALQKRQLGHVHGVLKEEGNDIEELKTELTRLNLEVI